MSPMAALVVMMAAKMKEIISREMEGMSSFVRIRNDANTIDQSNRCWGCLLLMAVVCRLLHRRRRR